MTPELHQVAPGLWVATLDGVEFMRVERPPEAGDEWTPDNTLEGFRWTSPAGAVFAWDRESQSFKAYVPPEA